MEKEVCLCIYGEEKDPSTSSSEQTYVSDNQSDEKDLVNVQKAQGHQISGENCSCIVEGIH